MVEIMDGPVDRGIEGGAGAVDPNVRAEAAAHAILRLVGDLPGVMGRIRAARVVGGFPVPVREDTPVDHLARYALDLDWPLREVLGLVDALIAGGLVAQTMGSRPMLVLTRAGFLALHALEGGLDDQKA